ncbi:unnamed protein product [Nesidiocoris tenuis]|uniref:Uncharacterized protein n=1 Tax=Nesidiocoris tenuis TaxID=355587 RepID=A0A6H5GYN2_9HEMI|nr:unnamed protein product [Nesidiocoris tenuis]
MILPLLGRFAIVRHRSDLSIPLAGSPADRELEGGAESSSQGAASRSLPACRQCRPSPRPSAMSQAELSRAHTSQTASAIIRTEINMREAHVGLVG